MKKTLIFFLFLFLPLLAFADQTTVDISKLSSDQQAQILKEINNAQSSTSTSTPSTSDVQSKLEKWKDIGEGLGAALVSASQQLGIAANQFVQTPVGKITMAIVVYKLIGTGLLQAISFLISATFFFSLAVVFFFKTPMDKVEYEFKPVLWGMFNRKKVKSYVINENIQAVYYLAGAVSIVIGLFFAANMF